MQDERSSRTERRILVLGMCLSYLGCLATLWYIWNAPHQWFDTLWLRFGVNRFTLIIIPLIVFCGCYFKLCCLAGDMLKLRGKQLDERQRMVRDSAHRTAYKIVTFLCLFISIYLAVQGLIAKTPATPTASVSQTFMIHPAFKIEYVDFVIVPPYTIHSSTIHSAIQWIATSGSGLHPATIWIQQAQTNFASAHPSLPNPAHTSLESGIYYSLVLLTLLLIVSTLPKAIIAWKER